jgi:transposase
MDTTTLEPRQQRALDIVKSKGTRIKHVAGNTWLVPSQTNVSGGYVVDVSVESCTCPDHEDRDVKCKHIWAVWYVRHNVTFPDGTTIVTQQKLTYTQDWPAYNKAQCEEKERVQMLLRLLCEGIVQPSQTKGRKRLPLRDVVYAATMKVYTTMSGRRATSDIRACEERGFVDVAPSYNSTFRYIEQPEMMPLLKMLVEESAVPLAAVETSFAPDSTGFSTNTYSRWFDTKYGIQKKEQRWVKLHAMTGTLTNIVTAVEVTESNVGDSPMFKPLLATTAANFNVQEVAADKAYLANKNLVAVEKLGGTPYIPFKSDSTEHGSLANEIWKKMWHLFSFKKEEFLAHYHKRSNVEATFSMMKRKFGAGVRAKLPAAQLNEVLLKCLCHNLSVLVHAIHELNIEPKFWEVSLVAGA